MGVSLSAPPSPDAEEEGHHVLPLAPPSEGRTCRSPAASRTDCRVLPGVRPSGEALG